MISGVKNTIKSIVPESILFTVRKAVWNSKTIRARFVFRYADAKPKWLKKQMLAPLQNKYLPELNYKYDTDSLERRGEERARCMLNRLPRKPGTKRFLEMGCGDGMVSCALQRKGKTTTAVDICVWFDERTLAEGVACVRMDVTSLGFAENSFDVVFSYAAFEHVQDPDRVLEEAIRVLRPGGLIYLYFGPLYMSPYGLHVYNTITVPYCHLLFTEQDLIDFTKEHNLDNPNYDDLNKWTIMDYRALWQSLAGGLRRVMYREYAMTRYVDLIIRHPSCFKSKTQCFDDLIIHEIEVLFQKQALS